MSRAREINGWRCSSCHAITYVVHVDDGVTPMFLGCRHTDGCRGTGISLMYPRPPVPAHVAEETRFEWYAPGGAEMRRLRREEPELYEHCRRGGLKLQPLSDAGREALKSLGVPAG